MADHNTRDRSPRSRPFRALLLGAFYGVGVGFLFGIGEILARHLPIAPFAAIAAPFYGGAGLLFGAGSGLVSLFLPRRAARLPIAIAGTAVAFPVSAALLQIVFERLPHGIAPATIAAAAAAFVVWLLLTLIAASLLRFLPAPFRNGPAILSAVAAIFLLLFGSPERRAEIDGPVLSGRPNVILILVDTLRADHLGIYGYPRATSPRIDRLAADGILYSEAYAQCSWTKPSVVSLLTSRYPFAFSRNDLYHRVPAEAELLAETFAAAGYRTGAIVANPVVSPTFGFDQGFETYDHGYLGMSAMRIYRYLLWLDLLKHPRLMFRADVLAGRAAAWLDRFGSEPFFLYLHFMDPHEGYEPGPPHDRLFRTSPPRGRSTLIYPRPEALPFDRVEGNPYGEAGLRELVDRYDGEIRRVDDAVGEIVAHLRAAGLYDQTTIALVADHGEEFLDHGGWGHGQSLYGELTAVPFLLKPPAPAGRSAALARRRVMLVDLGPTLLSICGIDGERGRDGVDLLAPGGERPAVGDVSAGDARIASIRRGPYHYVVARRGGETTAELFNVLVDPGEERDRAAAETAVVDSLAFLLDSLTAATEAMEAEEVPLDKGMVEQLRGLGYLQ